MMSIDENLFGFENLPAEAINLDEIRVERALKLSQNALNSNQQWQTYLQGLALFGTQQWLEEREPNLSINLEDCSIFRPELASPIDAVCNLKVGDFKLCILTVGSIYEDEIFVPRSAIELPEFAAHFYVLVEVCEELEQVNIHGFFRYDRLIKQQQNTPLTPQCDWTYAIPLSWFEQDPDQLLLYLRCLEPQSIPLPAIPTTREAELSQRRYELIPILSQLQSTHHPWWEIMTWEQAIIILTHPFLLEETYQLQSGKISIASFRERLATWGQQLHKPIMNTATWWQNELDRWAQEAAWVLLPPLMPVAIDVMRPAKSPLRSAAAELGSILQQLQQKGMMVNTQTYSAYRDFNLGNSPLRLYAVTWGVPSATQEPKWTLLLILSGTLEHPMPPGVTLQVSDEIDLCVQRQLPEHSRDNLLYIRVIGSWQETFSVQVSLPTGETRIFPPFGFQPNLC